MGMVEMDSREVVTTTIKATTTRARDNRISKDLAIDHVVNVTRAIQDATAMEICLLALNVGRLVTRNLSAQRSRMAIIRLRMGKVTTMAIREVVMGGTQTTTTASTTTILRAKMAMLKEGMAKTTTMAEEATTMAMVGPVMEESMS